MAEVVTLGESMVVFTPEELGPLQHAERFRRGVAGAESNCAIGLCRLGHTAAWMGRLGDDPFGAFIWNTLRGEGVDLGHARRDPTAPTAVMFKERRAGGDSRVLYYRRGSAASRMEPSDVDPAAVAAARWLHVTGITAALGPGPRAAVRAAVEVARAEGVGVSFDPNYRARLWTPEEAGPVLRGIAAAADGLLVGQDEGELLFGHADPEAIAEEGLRLGCRWVAVKLGAEGALIASPAGAVAIPPHPVAVVETTGAGDAFAAGMLAGLLEGRPLSEAGRLAAVCGALACTAAGDWEGAPDRAAALARMGGSRERLR